MTAPDPLLFANAKARGKRPAYLSTPESDRLLSMLMALASDVAVMRERLDTVERLLDTRGVVTRADIETYRPSRDAAYERGLLHRELVNRLLRGVQQDMEALAEAEPELEAISADLKAS